MGLNQGLGRVKQIPDKYDPTEIQLILDDLASRILGDILDKTAGHNHDGTDNNGPVIGVGGAIVVWKNAGTTVLNSAYFNNAATGLTLSNVGSIATLGLTSGYVIPTTTQETNWGTAYTQTHVHNQLAALETTGSPAFVGLTLNYMTGQSLIFTKNGSWSNSVIKQGTSGARLEFWAGDDWDNGAYFCMNGNTYSEVGHTGTEGDMAWLLTLATAKLTFEGTLGEIMRLTDAGVLSLPKYATAGILHNAVTTGIVTSSLIVQADIGTGLYLPATIDKNMWDLAYSWGDHSLVGYYKSGSSPSFAGLTIGTLAGHLFGAAGVIGVASNSSNLASIDQNLGVASSPAFASILPAFVNTTNGVGNIHLKLGNVADTIWTAFSLSGSQTKKLFFTLPVDVPTVSGQCLVSTDAGTMSWATKYGSGDSPSFLNVSVTGEYKLSADNPYFWFIDTAQATPAGRFLTQCYADLYTIRGRKAADNGWEDILTLARVASGGLATFAGSITSTGLTVNGATHLNATGASTGDFQVEGDTDAILIFADASSDFVGIGAYPPVTKLDIIGATDTTNGIVRISAAGSSDNVGLVFKNAVGGGGNSGSRAWQIATNYNAYGEFTLLRSTTATGAPQTAVLAIDSSSNAVFSGTVKAAGYQSADGSTGATAGVAVAKVGGGTRTLNFKNGLYIDYTDS